MNDVFDQPMPASVDAERALLGAVMLENSAYDSAAEALTVGDFAVSSHQTIFRVMTTINQAGGSIDIVTVAEELSKRKEVDAVGGISYIASLTEGLPRGLAVDEYVRIIREKSMLRQTIYLAQNLASRAFDQAETPEDLIAKADQQLLAISGDARSDWPDIEKQSHAEITRLNEQRSQKQASYFDYGIPKLDSLIGGLVKKEMTVLGGRPGQGKSALISQIAMRHGRRGVPVHVFTIEMSAGKFLRRMWAPVSGVPFYKLRHPHLLDHDEYAAVVRAMVEVASWPIVLDDAATVGIDQLLSRARISKRRFGTEILALDYLQKLRFKESQKYRYMEVTDAAVKLSRLAKEEDMAVLVLSSLTEAGEKKNRNHPPSLSDFRQSGDIQFEASTALLLHREVDPESEKLKQDGELIIAKARDDSQGIVPISFNYNFLQFDERQQELRY